MEYNVVATDTTAVAQQATEGGDLQFGKVSVRHEERRPSAPTAATRP